MELFHKIDNVRNVLLRMLALLKRFAYEKIFFLGLKDIIVGLDP